MCVSSSYSLFHRADSIIIINLFPNHRLPFFSLRSLFSPLYLPFFVCVFFFIVPLPSFCLYRGIVLLLILFGAARVLFMARLPAVLSPFPWILACSWPASNSIKLRYKLDGYAEYNVDASRAANGISVRMNSKVTCEKIGSTGIRQDEVLLRWNGDC